jgi:hypothetical protein
MTDPPIEGYLRWLAPQIRGEGDGSQNRTFEDLTRIMFEKEFVWLPVASNDRNRLEDGLALRVEFCNEAELRREGLGRFLEPEQPYPPCSFLEVLIGLSRRMSFAVGGEAPGWAWSLLTHLELHRMSDPVGRSRARRIDDILDRCIWRNYEPNGQGGFFPLGWPDEDQTKVEIWYQMAAWTSELHPGN